AGLAGIQVQVVAEVVAGDGDAGNVLGQVVVAQGIADQAERGLAVAASVLDLAQGDEDAAEGLDITGLLEGLAAFEQGPQRLVMAAEADGPGRPRAG
ncbi:MAG TPA: hypothetical protein VH478_17875, partial [Trebonia sp.]|nr:hypothetical protein [Trebonia sp.]